MIDKLSFIQNVKYFSKLISEILSLPICCYDDNNNSLFHFFHSDNQNPLIENLDQYRCSIFDNNELLLRRLPVLKSTKYYENYISIPLFHNDIYLGHLIAGPCIYSAISKETIESLIDELTLPLTYKNKLIDYYNSLIILDYKRFINTVLLLYSNIYEEQITAEELLNINSLSENAPPNNSYRKALSANRVNSFLHHSKESEGRLWQSIREGDPEEVKHLLSSPIDGNFGVLSKNSPVRAEKNLAICGIAIATRAAMEGGLNSEEAYTLSDYYIQEIEAVGDITLINAIKNKGLFDFTQRVKNTKAIKYKRAVLSAVAYIDAHLYESLSTNKLAAYVNLNQNYFSELFKKETGTTPIEYITKKRIDEAKYLLSASDNSISEIAALLAFHDQSHFTKVFKKHTGITPKKYQSHT